MSLRGAVNVVAALFLAGALVMAIAEPGAWPTLIPASFLAAACLFEQWRYRRISSALPEAGWVLTEERFVDPETGRLVAVYYHSATGGRRYVDIEDAN